MISSLYILERQTHAETVYREAAAHQQLAHSARRHLGAPHTRVLLRLGPLMIAWTTR
ncbi:MAG TPA: hypothetical protein VF276_05485 [Chloroflexia bacterium]